MRDCDRSRPYVQRDVIQEKRYLPKYKATGFDGKDTLRCAQLENRDRGLPEDAIIPRSSAVAAAPCISLSEWFWGADDM